MCCATKLLDQQTSGVKLPNATAPRGDAKPQADAEKEKLHRMEAQTSQQPRKRPRNAHARERRESFSRDGLLNDHAERPDGIAGGVGESDAEWRCRDCWSGWSGRRRDG